VIAGTHSGCGKTTITLGLMAALTKRGLKVQPFKAGPDFIDTGLHRLVTARHSRNLDIWMCGEKYVKECFHKYAANADISIIEGVMGMYDGEYSTARLAGFLNLPVILVVDASGMAESAGAVVAGFRDWGFGISKKANPQPLTPNPLAGIIFNRVASERHYERLKNSVCDIKVLGYLPRELDFEIPHRHLGLTVAEENPVADENIERLADAVLEHIDVDKILNIAQQSSRAPEQQKNATALLRCCSTAPKIAVAYDKAFCFYYEDNLDLLRGAGAEIVTFSPLSDNKIPEAVNALYIGGGYPELYAKELSQNTSMMESINNWALSGKPIYAECGGLMYLSKGIYDFDGKFFEMAGAFPFETEMKKGRAHLGYREILLNEDCILGKKGKKLRGHEFHYSEIVKRQAKPEGTVPDLRMERGGVVESGLSPSARRVTIDKVYSVRNNHGEFVNSSGYKFKNTLASYIHMHFGSSPEIVRNFLNHIKEQ